MIAPLPQLMVAPNGARKMPSDHPALPITIESLVTTAQACQAAGADGLHAHVRDVEGRHVLDAGLYRELIAEFDEQLPGLAIQITTEAVGRFSPTEQRDVVDRVQPAMVSVALREMCPGDDLDAATRFYQRSHEADIAVQHILYSDDDVHRLGSFVDRGVVPSEDLQCLFVLGRYADKQLAEPADLDPFLVARDAALPGHALDWAVCAFGPRETDCLNAAHQVGGKLRVGFENNDVGADGKVAADNAERVREIAEVVKVANGQETLTD